MKEELSSLDIKIIVSELQGMLAGARMEKFYQKEREIHILLHIPHQGTHTLVLGSGKLFLTKKRFEYAQTPPPFAMTLRKYLAGKKIAAISQHGFDRVVMLETETHRLIAELFRNGNMVLTDPDYKIWSMLEKQEWKDRSIKIREKYAFPAHGDVYDALSDLPAELKESGKQIVVFLASGLSLGGEYAEEIVLRANIEKTKICKDLSGAEIASISREAKKMLEEKPAPYMVLENEKIADFAPFAIGRHKGMPKKCASTFNEAVSEYFGSAGVAGAPPADTAKKAEKTKAGKYAVRLKQQVSALESIENAAALAQKTGDLIYSRFDFFQRAISEKEEKAAEYKLNRKEKTITVAPTAIPSIPQIRASQESRPPFPAEITPEHVENSEKSEKIGTAEKAEKAVIFYEEPLSKSAERYYVKAKRFKEKLARLKLEIERTKKEMDLCANDADSDSDSDLGSDSDSGVRAGAEAKRGNHELKGRKKAEWYHNFRWFFTSGGFLCVCGKDADTNEELIKRRTEKTDLVLHADITGSPFGLLKTKGKPADEKSIKEALEFVASYSRAWQAGVGIVEAYWVLPEQVTKKAPAGEYISKGSFMIYGKKNALKTELRLAIGIKNGELVCGAVSSVPEPYAVIKPGRIEAKKLAGEIKSLLSASGPKGVREKAEHLNADEIARHIPFGKGELAQ